MVRFTTMAKFKGDITHILKELDTAVDKEFLIYTDDDINYLMTSNRRYGNKINNRRRELISHLQELEKNKIITNVTYATPVAKDVIKFIKREFITPSVVSQIVIKDKEKYIIMEPNLSDDISLAHYLYSSSDTAIVTIYLHTGQVIYEGPVFRTTLADIVSHLNLGEQYIAELRDGRHPNKQYDLETLGIDKVEYVSGDIIITADDTKILYKEK